MSEHLRICIDFQRVHIVCMSRRLYVYLALSLSFSPYFLREEWEGGRGGVENGSFICDPHSKHSVLHTHTLIRTRKEGKKRENSSVCNIIIRWLIVVGELVSESSIDCRLYMWASLSAGVCECVSVYRSLIPMHECVKRPQTWLRISTAK